MSASGKLITSAAIVDGTIVDADVAAAAAIAVTKLAHVGANNVLKSSGSANVGGQIVNADVSASAAIADAKLAAVPYVSAYNGTNQAYTSGSYIALQMDTEIYDPTGMHNPADNTKITIGQTGYYLVNFQGTFDATASGALLGQIWLDGGASEGFTFVRASSGSSAIRHASVKILSAAQYLQLYLQQTSGSTVNLQAGAILQLIYLGHN